MSERVDGGPFLSTREAALTMTLTEFLLARIAEDEAAVEGFWSGDGDPGFMWGPGRIRAECEAKRRIVEEHRPTRDGLCCGCCWLQDLGSWEPYPCPTLRALALPYAERPDYRQEWKP
jgi:hypothetical protein